MLSFPSVSNCDKASAAWFLIPALCTTSNAKSDIQSRQRANLPVVSERLRMLLHAPWSIRLVSMWPPNVAVIKDLPKLQPKRSLCVVSELYSAMLSVISQLLSGGFVPWSCDYIKAQAFCLPLTSVPSVKYPLLRSKASTGVDIILSPRTGNT